MKTAIIFFAGLAVGGLGMRLYLKDKFDKELEFEIDKLDAAFKKELEELKSTAVVEVENITVKEDPINPLERRAFRSEIKKRAYDSYFNAKNEDEEEEEESMEPHPVEKPDTPYEITDNEFTTERSFEKTTLMYYYKADILTEDEEPLDDPCAILGDSWHEILGANVLVNDVVYVRNENLGTDYEVILDGSDADFVRKSLGFDT